MSGRLSLAGILKQPHHLERKLESNIQLLCPSYQKHLIKKVLVDYFLRNKYTENTVFSQITELFEADIFSSLHVRFPDTESKNTAPLFELSSQRKKVECWDSR